MAVDAAIIGEVVEKPEGARLAVFLCEQDSVSLRIMDMLVGEQLPRIC